MQYATNRVEACMRHYRIDMFGKGSVIARITLRHLAVARETRLGGEREFTATQLHTVVRIGVFNRQAARLRRYEVTTKYGTAASLNVSL